MDSFYTQAPEELFISLSHLATTQTLPSNQRFLESGNKNLAGPYLKNTNDVPNTDYIDKILFRQKRFKSMYVRLIIIMRCNEVGCRVPAVPAAGEPGGGGVHAPGHHVRALLELLRCLQPTYCQMSD